VNSTFYVWYDSWEEAVAGTKAHGDRIGWPDLPAEEIPSMQRYLREHTLGQMIDRLATGAVDVINHVKRSYGYPKYLALYSGVLLVALALRRRRALAGLKASPFFVLFFVAYFLTYAALYFWYAPIAAGDRLILAQFIPLLLVLVSGGRWLLRGDRLILRGGSLEIFTAVNIVALGIVVREASFALTRGVYILRGGG
jgi:hypothetical protein